MSGPSKVVANQTFVGQNIPVDNIIYRNCRFTGCRIIYQGLGPAHFENCTFDAPQWVFDGPAENTLQYLAFLYNALGPGGRDLVEGIFDSLRQGGIGHGILEPSAPAAVR